jgi:hypothetical protein
MTNLLAQAIDCDDAERAAKIIQDALGIESDDVVSTPSRRPGRLIASGAPVTSASGSRPKRVILARDRAPALPAAVDCRGNRKMQPYVMTAAAASWRPSR